jgi:hypothetical protein
MKVVYIAPGPFGKFKGGLFSSLASVRLRSLAIAPHLVTAGHTVRVIPCDRLGIEARNDILFEGDVYVFMKLFQDHSAAIDLLRARGKKVVLDVADNVYALEHLRGHYPDMLARVDLVTASSPRLAGLLAETPGPKPRSSQIA